MGTAGLADLSVLEKKINQAAELIEQLRDEKKQSELANKALKEEIESLYIKNEELTRELKNINKEKNKKKDFEKTREELNSKIEEMLEKLDGLDL